MCFDLLRRIALGTLLVALSSVSYSQNAEREYEDIIEYDTYLEVLTSDGKISLTPYSENIVEVQFLTPLQPAHPPSWSVIQDPAALELEVDDQDEKVIVVSGNVTIEINKEPFQLSYSHNDRPLFSENLGYFEENGQSGFKFNMAEGEVIYGGGERALPMNRRGYSMPLYNDPSYNYARIARELYYSIPLVISSNRYMILFDNAPKGTLDVGEADEDVLSMYSIGGRKVYYVIAEDSYYDLNTEYTNLTGRQPLPPRWTLGNIASRFGYRTQKEAEDTIALYREKSVPVDSVVIDLYWFGKEIQGHMGNLDWDYEAWPKPKKMMKDFKKDGVKTVLITEPFILKTSKRWQDALDNNILVKDYRGETYVFDFYFGTGSLIDIFKPEAKSWFWDIYKHHMEDGVSAWWGDLGEPESHASDIVHVNGSADYVHNVYGHEWAKMLYDGYTRDYPERRPVSLMRAGFAGSQRYGMIPWSGDVKRHWSGLEPQPILTMQMGMQGLGYTHSDLGGFAPHYINDELFVDPMLYTRWLQYGVFQPIFRPHAHESTPTEPVYWDERTLALTRKAIDLRYQLFAYNYTLAYENATKGYPLMRPLIYVEPNNPKVFEYSTSYLWGENILVAPVLKSEQKIQEVYFPQNGNWVDFYTGAKFKGGATAKIPLVDDYIPTYVKTGSFLPLLPEGLQTTKDYSTEKLEVIYYKDSAYPTASYVLFDDDGETHNTIKNGDHELITFSANHTPEQHQFTVSSNGGKFKGRPRSRTIALQIHQLESIPSKVVIDGKTLDVLSKSELGKKRSKQYAVKTGANSLEVQFVFKKKDVNLSF